MAEQSLKDRAAKGFFWGGVSNGLVQLLSAVFGIFLARILSEDDYGMVGMLLIFSLIASAIQESGFTTALTNKKEASHRDYNAVFWFSLIAAFILYIILFFSAPFIASFFDQPALTALARYQFLGFLISSTGTAHYAILFKQMRVKTNAKITLTALLVSGTVGVLMAYYGMAYWGLATQNLLYVSISAVMRWFYSGWRPTFEWDFTPIKEMWPFSAKILLTNITNIINNNLFSVLLGRFYNEGDVGQYTQGNKWKFMGESVVFGMINSITQPLFAQLTDERERAARVFRKVLRFISFISFPTMLGLAFISEEFIVIAIGEKWLPAVSYLRLLCISGSISPIILLYTQYALSKGKSTLYFRFNMVFCLSQLAAALLMIRWGIMPMIVVYVCNYFLLLIAWQLITRKYTTVSHWEVIKDVGPFLFVTLLSLGLTYLFTLPITNIYMLLIAKIAIAAILYVLLMKLLGTVIFEESMDYIKSKFLRKH